MSGYKRYTIRVGKNNGQNLKVNNNGKLEYIYVFLHSVYNGTTDNTIC